MQKVCHSPRLRARSGAAPAPAVAAWAKKAGPATTLGDPASVAAAAPGVAAAIGDRGAAQPCGQQSRSYRLQLVGGSQQLSAAMAARRGRKARNTWRGAADNVQVGHGQWWVGAGLALDGLGGSGMQCS